MLLRFLAMTRRSSWVVLGLFLLVYTGALALAAFRLPAWGDESHFIHTIGLFANNLSLHFLQTYPEMSGPLPFLLYAGWGRIFSFDLPVLRLLSLLITWLTAASMQQLFLDSGKSPLKSLALTVFVLLNPYVIGFSVFVFTDMLALLFLVLAALAMQRQQPLVLSLAVAGGMLTRQYFFFFPLAAAVFYLVQAWQSGQEAGQTSATSGRTLAGRAIAGPVLAGPVLAIAVGVLPSLALFWLWQGLSPQNDLRALYTPGGVQFHPEFLTLYVVQLGVYLAPINLMRWRALYSRLPIWAAALALSLLYIWFPVQASAPALAAGITTAGFFHRFTIQVFGANAGAVLYAAFLFGLPVLLHLLLTGWQNRRTLTPAWALRLAILLFFALMPFSYLGWEKYFCLILPLLALELSGESPPGENTGE